MATYRITLAYDGTGFVGWQRQAHGAGRTVQGAVEEALARLAAGRPVAVAAAGRTDAGVHALGQVASFELDRQLDVVALTKSLNALLPSDVRVCGAARAPDGFHARRSALGKHYRYVLDVGGVRLPQRRLYAGWTPWRLDEAAVREAAALYRGRLDFATLASAGGSTKTTVRSVTRSEVSFCATGLVYEVEADGFLRHMVRSMVGGLVAAGRGAVTITALARALEARDRRLWPAPAPACGLTLVRVVYPVLG